MFSHILDLLDKGDVVGARKVALQSIVLRAAYEEEFDWVNHPEYLEAKDIKENGREVTASVSYRGANTKQVVVRR